MLREITNVRQVTGDAPRRWFSSRFFDLIVWYGTDETPTGFQLCYDKANFERVLTWREAGGYSHMAIDDGEGRPLRHKAAPVLIADGVLDTGMVSRQFAHESLDLPDDLKTLISSKLHAYSVP